jgi:hypothetical protein
MTERSFDGWRRAPRVGLLLPPEGAPGWTDAAFWSALLEAWGIPTDRLPIDGAAAATGSTVIVVPAAALGEGAAELASFRSPGIGILLVGGVPGPAIADRVRFEHADLLERMRACMPAPDAEGAVRVDARSVGFEDDGASWDVCARWLLEGDSAAGPAAVATRRDGDAIRVWFGISIEQVDGRSAEAVVAAAGAALELAAPEGFVALWRWPEAKAAALVVDGDVDHPTGVDPECSRYVAPALETARRAGFDAYGIFAAAANVDHEPGSFPPAPGYYNHSFGHPYSHWDPRPWEALDETEMERELTRSDATFRRRLGRGDERIFRLPHFQLEASDRTYAVLDRLGYLAESSIGANMSVTGGLPYHPALRPWSVRPTDAAYARTHPDRSERHTFLQLPISTDPTDPGFLNGCCSYNTLSEGVRNRTADPAAYEAVLDDVVERSVARGSLAHLFIDPPDAGYGRLAGDIADYAAAVERWLGRCVARDDLAILTTAGLAAWWRAREAAVDRLSWRVDGGELTVTLDDPPEGATLALFPSRVPGEEPGAWRLEAI